MKLKKKRVIELLEQLEQIESEAKDLEKKYEKRLKKIHPANQKSALNLIHYLALRNQDIRELQDTLGQLGISRLGRAESHVMASITTVKNLLIKIHKKEQLEEEKPLVSFKKGRKIIRSNTSALLGKKLKGSKVRIMVTLPTEAADDYKYIKKLVSSGMNSARVNCAHDDTEVWKRMIDKIHKAKTQTGRNVKVCMDLGGPKLRTGTMRPGPKVVRLQPERDLIGKVTSPSEVWLAPQGTESDNDEDMIIPVPKEWLNSLKNDSIIAFTDSRNKKCKLKVDKQSKPGWMAKCYDSAYVTTGTVLTIKNENKGEELTTEVGEMLPLEEKIILKVGDKLMLHKEDIAGDPAEYDDEGNLVIPAHISCTLPEVFSDVKVGEQIILDDGKIEGEIKSVDSERIEVKITYAKEEGAKLRADKGINLPESQLSISGLTVKDKEDLKFVAKYADVVNISFVNNTQDVFELLAELKTLNAERLGIILKIETKSGVKNLPAILLAAMRHHPIGVMIARGDLAIECGWKELAQTQEEILWLCEAAHIPIVWATQVLETMAKKGRPSRAEITDAASAEQAECVMLNKGPHIFEVIKILDEILSSMQDYHEKKAPMLPPLKMLKPDVHSRRNSQRRDCKARSSEDCFYPE
ncbi:MAG: pyruvate kinase [Ignavibacteriaceae bacterium]